MFKFRQKLPNPRFGQGIFVTLLLAFMVLTKTRPVVGLAGLGVTLIIAATLIEVNRKLIWEQYKRRYKKRRGIWQRLHEPKEIYNTLNVYIVWPAIFILGVASLVAALRLS